MATVSSYGVLGSLIEDVAELLGNKELYSIEGLKKVYHDDTLGLLNEDIPYTEAIINDSLEVIKEALSVSSNNTKPDELIHDMLIGNVTDVTELEGYDALAASLENAQFYFERGYTLDNLLKIYHDKSAGVIDRTAISYTEKIMLKVIDSLKTVFGTSSGDIDTKIDKLIHEWNENIASIIGVKCNTFEEFAEQVVRVSSDWVRYKLAEIQPHTTTQNQMFVDVNTLLSENNYLKTINQQKDEAINTLKAHLVALGQTV